MSIMWLQITSLIYMTTLLILFYSKKRLQSIENTIFKTIMIVNEVGLVIDLLCFYVVSNINKVNLTKVIVTKSLLIYYLVYILLFTFYIFIIMYKNKDKKFFTRVAISCLIYFCVNSIVISILPMYYYNGANGVYSYGPAVNYLFIVYTVLIVIWIVLMFINHSKIKRKEFIPVFILIILGTIAGIIQKNMPALVIMTGVDTLVTFIMYFTIENPDIKMAEQLEIAKNSADKANRAKTDFLSSMSHEIRTPLNAIVGFSDCITEANSLDEAKENAKDIVNASETLLEIVNGILDISKIEAGKLEIINSNYDAKELFEELAKLIKPKMDDKALDFKYYIAPDLPNVLYGDQASIKKVVTNLLSNASKYTDTGFVKYEVHCIRNNDTCKLIISVEDSGRGIKKESVDKLFTKFQRVEEDKNTTIEGTGLGLAITKQLVELMGGKIIVHTVYGEGSKFTVMLTQKIEKEEIKEEKKTVSDSLDLSNSKILIVDDNELNLKVATKLLQRYNATHIDCIDSGFRCLDRINGGNHYDVILLDDMMPKMSGIETLKKLKEIDGFNMPVVALTANAITGMKEKYLNSGFDDYLAKPIEKNELITVMNRILGDKVVVEDDSKEEKPVEESNGSSNDFDGEKYLRDNGIDMDKALELLGDMDMYNDTLDDYLSEVDSKLEELKKYKESNDMENYAILVHSMKSDAKYLGFMDFADIAYQHELKSKDNDSEFVNENFSKLEEELTKVLKIAREYKEKI